jgi:hypothetical protein
MTRRTSEPRGLTRRTFLAATGVGAAVVLAGCGGSGGADVTHETIFALSGRGRRISNAAKAHNANLRFTSPLVALANRAHPGDTSKVVQLDVSRAEFNRLFGAGNVIADLRHV